MTIRPFLLSLSLALSVPALGCLNDYEPNPQAIARSKSLMEQLTQHQVKEDWAAREVRLRKQLANGGDYRVKNDLATTLTHTSQAAEAVTLLEQIEAEKPGLYATAANLGTAYELSGNDEKALEWIQKGIERNPEAHEGTEWLHVRILEAKIALNKDPQWLETNSVLGPVEIHGQSHVITGGTDKLVADRGRAQITATNNRRQQLTLAQVKSALIYQLHERLQFVKPPEAVVGSMLVDLGDLVGDEPIGGDAAGDVYKLGNQYLAGCSNVESLQLSAEFRNIDAIRQQRAHGRRRGWAADLVPFLAIVVLARSAVLLFYERFARNGMTQWIEKGSLVVAGLGEKANQNLPWTKPHHPLHVSQRRLGLMRFAPF